MWGPVYPGHIVLAYNRSRVPITHSPRLLQVFQTIYLPNTRHLAGWLQSWNHWQSLRASLSLYFPYSVAPHMWKPICILGKKKRPSPFIDDAFAGEQVWGRHCGVVLEDLCEYIQVDAMKYTTVLPLINASNIGEHLITVFKKKSENLLPRNLQEILCVVSAKQLQRP